jgi:hypothetical protein
MSDVNVVRKRAETILIDGINKYLASVMELNCHTAYTRICRIILSLVLKIPSMPPRSWFHTRLFFAAFRTHFVTMVTIKHMEVRTNCRGSSVFLMKEAMGRII